MIDVIIPTNAAYWGYPAPVVDAVLAEYREKVRWMGPPARVFWGDSKRLEHRGTKRHGVVFSDRRNSQSSVVDAAKWYDALVTQMRQRMAEVEAGE